MILSVLLIFLIVIFILSSLYFAYQILFPILEKKNLDVKEPYLSNYEQVASSSPIEEGYFSLKKKIVIDRSRKLFSEKGNINNKDIYAVAEKKLKETVPNTYSVYYFKQNLLFWKKLSDLFKKKD